MSPKIRSWLAPPRAFVTISLCFGTLLAVLTPPFQVPDEILHFLRAYQISEGRWVSQTSVGIHGGVLPSSLFFVWGRFRATPFHPNLRVTRRQIEDAMKIPLRGNDRQFIQFPNTASYPPTLYIPQALAIALGRGLGLCPLVMMYLGREANLLAWIAMVYISLRLAPALKRGLMLLMLMPMSLFLAASLSADAMTIGIALLATSLIWHCAESGAGETPMADGRPANALGVDSIVALIVTTSMLTLAKFAYMPLLALLFLIPRDRFGSRRRHLLVLEILILINLAVFGAWFSETMGLNTNIRPERPDVNFPAQLAFVEGHPAHFIAAFGRTLPVKGPGLMSAFVGLLGWSDTPLSPVFVAIYLAGLGAACWLSRDDAGPIASWRLAVMGAAIFASFLIIALLNYAAWTPVGADIVDGLQGRYFIPLAPAAMMIIWSLCRRLPQSSHNNTGVLLDAAAVVLAVGGCVYASITIYRRFFG